MITNYYTLLALVREWNLRLEHAVLVDAYSASRDELSLVFEGDSVRQTLRLSARPGSTFGFLTERAGRPRRNVTTLFEEVIGLRADGVSIAERDRFVYIHLADAWSIVFKPFGPRPNVFLVRELPTPTVVHALSSESRWVDKAPPATRPARKIDSLDDFQSVWRASVGTARKRLGKAYPLLGDHLVRELLAHADVEGDSEDVSAGTRKALYESARQIEEGLSRPTAHVYAINDGNPLLSLVELTHLADQHADFFDSVNAAVSACVRRRLRNSALAALREPMLKAIRRELRRVRSNIRQIDSAEAAAARANEYEKWGHLLMAQASTVGTGETQVRVQDLMEAGDPVDIPLEPELSAVENATRYYEKAGRLRREQDRIPERKDHLETRMARLEDALARAETASSVAELHELQQRILDPLGLSAEASGQAERRPFRRFHVTGGFEVLVGRNARENELLTWKTAAKHDLWFHARGVSGSHVVLRVGARDTQVPRRAREEAAAIAAYYSKAKSSGLVPVHMAARKYLARARGAQAGTVRLLREEVLLVEPALPNAAEPVN